MPRWPAKKEAQQDTPAELKAAIENVGEAVKAFVRTVLTSALVVESKPKAKNGRRKKKSKK